LIKKIKLSQPPTAFLQNSGWNWTTEDVSPYISDELVQVTEKEADAYYKAAEELYEMYIKAAEWVIKTKNYEALGIPKNIIPLIEHSWENDENWHLYGRFDLSGGLDNEPIKLIEFNADTATCLPETAIIQWASLMANNLSENQQFNTLFESLVATFEKIKSLNKGDTPTLLLSTMKGFPEDETNISIIAEAAQKAGFEVDTDYIENLEFSKEEGIFKINSEGEYTNYSFWFKLIPWEFIAWDEPELLEILTELVLKKKLIVLNPAYTLLFQSKGILKVLWDLYPNHPLLLETKNEPLYGKKSVKKVYFGREGANVQIISSYGTALSNSIGEYQSQPSIYQEFVEFMKDDQGDHYQAGVFYSSEPCGLGFRKGDVIIDNKAMFCGHLVV
jgi:glutathionylspermidine synthase